MKKLILPVLYIGLSFSFFAQEISYNICKRDQTFNQLKYSPNVNTNQILQQNKYDVGFYRLNLSATNTSTDLSGIVEIHATATQSIDSALLEFSNSYNINEVLVNNVATNYARYGNLLSVPLDLPENATFVITVDYDGTPPTNGGFAGVSGINNQTSPSWGDKITYTLSEPFAAFEWFPCKQDLKDKADSVQVNITVPENLMAGSNGLLDSVVTNNNLKTFYWTHRHPIAYYLISISVGDYQDYTIYAHPTGSTDSIMIQNFIYNNPLYFAYFKDDIDQTADFVELFSDLYGPYPFRDEKYGHCTAPFGGGMEHQTMTTQGIFEIKLTAHELAHQWFGNNVTCSSWADIWINEGFASYSEYLVVANINSFNEAQSNMVNVHQNVMSAPGGSVWVTDSINDDRIFSGRLTYDKGGAIIHTLRYIINNDSLFFKTLQDFQVDFGNSTSSGLDFKNYVEQKTNINLSDFFNQWYFGEGFPTYSVEYNTIGSDVNILIHQVVSMPSVTPIFTNPVDLQISRSGGLGDTIVRVEINSNEEFVTISNIENFEAVISIDPLNYIVNQSGTISENPKLAISTQSKIDDVILYPNPLKDNLTFQFSGESPRAMRIINQRGQLVLKQNVSSSEIVDLSKLAKGQYLVELTDLQKNIVRRKVIKR